MNQNLFHYHHLSFQELFLSQPLDWWVTASDLHLIQFQRLFRFGVISWLIRVLLLPRTLRNIWDLELKRAANEPMPSLTTVVSSGTVDVKTNNKPPSACKNYKGCQVFWAFRWEKFLVLSVLDRRAVVRAQWFEEQKKLKVLLLLWRELCLID